MAARFDVGYGGGHEDGQKGEEGVGEAGAVGGCGWRGVGVVGVAVAVVVAAAGGLGGHGCRHGVGGGKWYCRGVGLVGGGNMGGEIERT